MRTRVTAILVAQQGGEWLDQTIAGLASQTRAPAAIIAVNNGGSERVGKQLLESGADRVVGIEQRIPFGGAVARGVQAMPEVWPETTPESARAADAIAAGAADGLGAETGADAEDLENDWIWLLTEDSCPEPAALSEIVNRVQRAPSVVVAGPKLVDWDHPERIIELGQSLTRYGSRWLLRRQELDQQQYDHMQDVLGVGPVGMLVRRDVWNQLGGFDPALPVYDDGLDFCVRARLAGHRVEVAPESRLRFAQSGIAGPRIDRKRSVLRAAHRQGRTSQLHRRVSYAPPVISFFEWLALPIVGVARVFWALIREQPGHMWGELFAAFAVFFRPHLIFASRRRIRRNSSAGWAAIRPLRVDPKTVRTAKMIDREAILAQTGRQHREMHFISSGGLAVLIAAIVAAVALTWWALPQTSLSGGGLAPLSSLGELWWNTRTLDGVPADPFTWVLALLGTITFWNPSHIVVILMVAAIPLTALGGWIWAAQLTESKSGRALVGLGFSLSPVLLGSLEAGRLPTLVLAVVLPWLLLAATRCRESWSWAGTASLLAAVALAAAPILIPLALVMLVVGLFSSLRGVGRVLTTALVPLALFAPKAATSVLDGRPLDILQDPGLAAPYTPGSTWHLLLGFPEFGLDGWEGILEGAGLGGPPTTLLVGICMLLVALLALVGLFTGRVTVTLFNALFGGLGMLTALGAAQLQLSVSGDQSVSVWTGSGLAVYWISVLTLAAMGADALRRAAPALVSLALATAVVAVAPVGAHLLLDQVPFKAGNAQMPAIVQAAGETNPAIRTLVITSIAPHEVRAQVVSGTGTRLDAIRTAEAVPEETKQDRELAELVGGLSSSGGADVTDQLKDESIAFVLLPEGSDATERMDLQRIFDQHSSLVSAGSTDQGLLWRVADSETADGLDGDAAQKLGGTSFTGHTIWVVQLAVLVGMLLLALPTGEVTYRPERRKRPRRRSRESKAQMKQAVAAQAETGRDSAEPPVQDVAQSVPDPAQPVPDPAQPEAEQAQPEPTQPEQEGER